MLGSRASVTLAGAAVFAALAALMTLARASIPYPIIPYLQIDFSEIPILMGFFLFGLPAATIATVIQWIFLNSQGADAPLGPAIKFVAIMSTLLGFVVGEVLYRKLRMSRSNRGLALSLILGSGMLLRIIAMTVVNYFVLIIVGPVFFGQDYLTFARLTLEKTLNWQIPDNSTALVYTLLFTALYNVINTLVAAVPAGLIVSPMTSAFKHITSAEAWLAKSLS